MDVNAGCPLHVAIKKQVLGFKSSQSIYVASIVLSFTSQLCQHGLASCFAAQIMTVGNCVQVHVTSNGFQMN
jgi:hypothetical protein